MYDRIYNRTTFGLGKGCLAMVLLVVAPVAVLAAIVHWAWCS